MYPIFSKKVFIRESITIGFLSFISNSYILKTFFPMKESDFVNTIVLPAFQEVAEYFEVKPIVVRISKTDNEIKETAQSVLFDQK